MQATLHLHGVRPARATAAICRTSASIHDSRVPDANSGAARALMCAAAAPRSHAHHSSPTGGPSTAAGGCCSLAPARQCGRRRAASMACASQPWAQRGKQSGGGKGRRSGGGGGGGSRYGPKLEDMAAPGSGGWQDFGGGKGDRHSGGGDRRSRAPPRSDRQDRTPRGRQTNGSRPRRDPEVRRAAHSAGARAGGVTDAAESAWSGGAEVPSPSEAHNTHDALAGGWDLGEVRGQPSGRRVSVDGAAPPRAAAAPLPWDASPRQGRGKETRIPAATSRTPSAPRQRRDPALTEMVSALERLAPTPEPAAPPPPAKRVTPRGAEERSRLAYKGAIGVSRNRGISERAFRWGALAPPPAAARPVTATSAPLPEPEAIKFTELATGPQRTWSHEGVGAWLGSSLAAKNPTYVGASRALQFSTKAWLLSNVRVRTADDPGKDDCAASPALAARVNGILASQGARIGPGAITVLRKGFDPRVTRSDRGSTHFCYTVLVDGAAVEAARPQALVEKKGLRERLSANDVSDLLRKRNVTVAQLMPPADPPAATPNSAPRKPPHVVVVGAGPAGLFAALALTRATNADGSPARRVTLLDRGQPVEKRGRDIGALFARRRLNPESNVCFGEGGAGTWSDGKLTTRIGRNEGRVRAVFNALVEFGADPDILTAAKPHIGTDKLVRILRAFRASLVAGGADVRFGARVAEVVRHGGRAAGVRLEGGETLDADAVLIAPGHSARDVYDHLREIGVELAGKPFAMGFRIEHPQATVDKAQYGAAAEHVHRGAGPVPPADYKLAADVRVVPSQRFTALAEHVNDHEWLQRASLHGAAPAPLGAAHEPAVPLRSVYSFCMCPGGQIVPTSTREGELCINGMSFSRRNSKWANAALVVNTIDRDWAPYEAEFGALAGAELQRVIERRAALMAAAGEGGAMCVPAQRVRDFLDGRRSADLPPSSYRLGTVSAPLHELYPAEFTEALRAGLVQFQRRIGTYLSEDAVLHAAETRTSAPVRIVRDAACESVSLAGLYPCGEGAGYAGGIVSAAVDGLRVAAAVLAPAAAREAGVSRDEMHQMAGNAY